MYIEYYIIENLLINYIIISCTSILIKRHTNEKKKWIGAFLGTIYSVAYLYPTLGVLFTLPFKLIIMTFIILTSFTYKDKKEFIEKSLAQYLNEGWSFDRMDGTMQAILLCAVYEITNTLDIDVEVIIQEYVDLAYAFFAKSEPKMVNALLDQISKEIR